MINTESLQMILIPDKGEISAESHNELLDILHNLLLDNLLINISNIPCAKFFSVDKIQKILILEAITARLANSEEDNFCKKLFGICD